ncbi:MAG TPA: arsenate reductase ArsC [Nitrospinota bacterium]|nr:arsenate reductase ArsC [Nitrospinota bacterium]
MVNKKRILFLCTGNSCRSQMAEGFLRSYAGSEFDVFSAGTDPKELNPLAVGVMKERAVDISGQRSESVDEFKKERFDYIITVCDRAKEICPFFSGKTERIHWSFEDPASAKGSEKERIDVFRSVRDEIDESIISFLKDKTSC